MKQILVLFGGCSPEYSVSLASAYGVLTHMDRSLYQPIPVGITREGAWRWYGGALEAIPEDRWQQEPACLPCTLRLDRGGAALLLLDGSGRTLAFEGAFPLIHGSNGEDGTLQGVVTHLIFKGVHYEMEVTTPDGFEWLVHSTDMFPVGRQVGIHVEPFEIQIMNKPASEDEEALGVNE